MPKRLPDSQKAAIGAFIEAGDSEMVIARKCGISRSSVQRYKKMIALRGGDELKDVASIKKHIGDKAYIKADTILDAINPDKISKASLQQLSLSSAILIDKARLISGESTSNISIYAQASGMLRNVLEGRAEQVKDHGKTTD